MWRQIIIRRCFERYIINRKLINSKLKMQVGREKHGIGKIYNNFIIDNIYTNNNNIGLNIKYYIEVLILSFA